MAAGHFVVGGILSAGGYVPGGIGDPPNKNVVIRVMGGKANTIIAFCYLMIIVYALTLAPVCWIYAAEVWSLETRAAGMAIAATGYWLFNFALGLYIPTGFQNVRYGLFIVFGAMWILAAAWFFFTYPEVSCSTLELPGDALTFIYRPAASHWRKSSSCFLMKDQGHSTPSLANPDSMPSLNRLERNSSQWTMSNHTGLAPLMQRVRCRRRWSIWRRSRKSRLALRC